MSQLIPLLILGPSTPEMDQVEEWAKTTRVKHTFTHTVKGRRACVGQLEWGFFYPGDDWEQNPDSFTHIRVGSDIPCPDGVEVIDVEAQVQAVRDVVASVYSRSIRDAVIGGVDGRITSKGER